MGLVLLFSVSANGLSFATSDNDWDAKMEGSFDIYLPGDAGFNTKITAITNEKFSFNVDSSNSIVGNGHSSGTLKMNMKEGDLDCVGTASINLTYFVNGEYNPSTRIAEIYFSNYFPESSEGVLNCTIRLPSGEVTKTSIDMPATQEVANSLKKIHASEKMLIELKKGATKTFSFDVAGASGSTTITIIDGPLGSSVPPSPPEPEPEPEPELIPTFTPTPTLGSPVLTEVQGHVEIYENFKWVKVTGPIKLNPGSKIRTGDDGRVFVGFLDGSSFNIAPKTEVDLCEKSKKCQFDLKTGKIKYKLKRLPEDISDMLLKPRVPVNTCSQTNTCVQTIRGTEFITTYDPKINIATFYVTEGSTEVTNLNATTVLFTGDKLTIDNSGSHFKELFTTIELSSLMKEFETVHVEGGATLDNISIEVIIGVIVAAAAVVGAIVFFKSKKGGVSKQKIPKFCRKCGTPTTSSNKFCKKCGNVIIKTI